MLREAEGEIPLTTTAFEMLEVGLTKEGKPFYIPRFHTLIAAATGAGKTVAARKIVSAQRGLIPDIKVLIFDVKSSIPGYSPLVVRFNDGSVDIVSFEYLWNHILRYCLSASTRNYEFNAEECFELKCTTWDPSGSHKPCRGQKEGCPAYRISVLSIEQDNPRHMAHWIRIKTVLRHNYKGKLIRLNTLDGLVDTSPNHSVIKISKDHNREGIADAKEIREGDWLSEPYLPRILRKKGDFLGTEELSWLYGFFLAEGWISHKKWKTHNGYTHNGYTVVMSNSNKALLEKARNILQKYFNHPVSLDKRPKSEYSIQDPFTITVTSRFIYEHFRKMFYLEKPYNSTTKRVPKKILNAPVTIQKAFLEGYWDGDGHRDEERLSRCATTSQLAAMGIIWLMKSLFSSSWSLHIRDDKPNSLDLVFNQASKNRDKRNVVKKVRQIDYTGHLFDIETDGGDHTFCTGIGPIRVHNTGRDWQGYGVDVPIYVETATDSRFLRDLIETQERRKIDWFFYELHMACQATKTWNDVLKNLRTRYNKYKDKNQMKEEKLGTLIIYMEALVSELDKGDITSTFDLSNPVTVVPLNYREDAFKQLVVYSYLTAMKRKQIKRVLIVCDEMSSLAPSMSGTGCKRIIEQYLFKQGRAAEVFGLAIDQEITGISPSVRRQCWNWILGMQTDTSAQERTVKQIPGKKLELDDISTLGVGWWWAVIRTPSSTEVEKFYLIPEGVSKEIGQKIVSGEVKVEQIMQGLHITKKMEENDEMYKEQLEESKRENEKLKEHLSVADKTFENQEGIISELQIMTKDLQRQLAKYAALRELFTVDIEPSIVSRIDTIEETLKTKLEPGMYDLGMSISELRQALTSGVRTGVESTTSVSMAEIDERINQRLATLGPERVVTVDVDDRIKELVKNETISRIVTKIQQLADPAKKAAWWMHERKKANIKELYKFVYDKAEVSGGGRLPGTFYMNVITPLEDAWLIHNDSGAIRWTLQERLMVELKQVLTEEDIQKVPKYLASLLL